MSSMSPQAATTICGSTLDDECNPDLIIPAQVSTTARPQLVDHSSVSSRDEGHSGVQQAPPIATELLPQLESLGDRDVRSRKATGDRKPVISTTLPTIDHSLTSIEAKNEYDYGIPIRLETPFISSEYPSIDCGGEDVQGREAGHGVGPDFSIPKGASNMTTKLDSVDHGDKVVQRGDAPSTSFFQGSSNVEITGSNFYEVRGNATIIRFGDGQFTDVQRSSICDYIANLTVLPGINDNLKNHVLTQSIISLPRAEAMFNDYQTKKKSGPCFEGTRVSLLREMADWITCVIGPGASRVYVLSGLAGIGKSTVAYTIASRAADLNILGASFFFSRDEDDRNNAKRFFTTIAYQLCIYNETFAKAIGDAMLTKRGSAATTKDPRDQLQALILEPLRCIVQSHSRPILIVVDALDECDEEEAFSVLAGLNQLVRDLPAFKIILTTRPQPYFHHFLVSQDGHRIFHLQDIEDKVVDGDIRLYLNYSLSLEQVQKRYPKRQWCASEEEIESLVRAVGRLFIIASTAVRYILDKTASNPAAQMQKLLSAFAQYLTPGTPFKDLDHFYTVILRNVVPENCDDHIVSRYQSVVGAIILVQRPLPVPTLAHLINIDVDDIHAVLDHLQSVILLDSDDVPRIYHKSFPDYLTDQARCKEPCLQIDTRLRHIRIVTRCFEVMDKQLKRNILGLGDPARFMSNEDGLKEDGITEEQLQEKVSQVLRYACVYWANHLENANIEDTDVMNGLENFVDDHVLHWFEVLSLIGKLDLAHRAVVVALKLLKSRPSDLHQLLSDALRFIAKFYERIKQSALHTYYSALPFTPTDSPLHRRYIKDAAHNICTIEGGPEKWDALIVASNLSRNKEVDAIKFSLDSALFVSHSPGFNDRSTADHGILKIWDATTGTPISTIPGHMFAVADDFSTVVSSEDKTITFYNMNGNARGTMFTTSSKIKQLAFSSESSRVAAALSDGTVWLWDSRNAKLIDSFDGYGEQLSLFQFSSTGTRFAFWSANGIKLRDGISGKSIADLPCESHGLHASQFSGDGSRIASLSPDGGLILWNSESGGLIAVVKSFGPQRRLAISANGSLLATADGKKVTLWSENLDSLVQIKVLELTHTVWSMAFSLDSTLVVATSADIKLYNAKTHASISTISFRGTHTALALSPDFTRLATGDDNGDVYLWDIEDIDAPGPPSEERTAVTALALSRDCSRLACGFESGTVELWGTNPTTRRISTPSLYSKIASKLFFNIFRQSRHMKPVCALRFNPDGRLFVSGSGDGTIKLWNGEDGALRGTLKVAGELQAVALSNGVLVAAWSGWDDRDKVWREGVTLWSLDSLNPIHTLNDKASKLSIAENNTLIALFFRNRYGHVAVLDAVNHTTIATFDLYHHADICTITFLPDNSQLVVQYNDGLLESFDLNNKCKILNGPTLEHLIQLPDISLWRGVPIWQCSDQGQHYFSALFSQHKSRVPVLWIPREIPVTVWTQGSSMIALGCRDGRVILLRLPTSNVS